MHFIALKNKLLNFSIPAALILFYLTASYAQDAAQSVLAIRQFVNTAGLKEYDGLREEFAKRLSYELLPSGMKPVLVDIEIPAETAAIIDATIEKSSAGLQLRFRLSGAEESGEEVKTLPLAKMGIEEILDIMTTKTRHFLEQSVSGKLRITSIPLDCGIYLNGIRIGQTPADFVVEKGTHSLRIEREHLFPYVDTIEISPGKQNSIQASLDFRGLNAKPWIAGALLTIAGTGIAQFFEMKYHHEYKALPPGLPAQEFDSHYFRYRNVSYAKVALLNAAILATTVSGYQLARNRFLKSKLFGKND